MNESWVRPMIRGKQTDDVEFGAKVEMSVVDGFLRIEDLRWDAFNESTTLQQSVEAYRKSYGTTRSEFWQTQSSVPERTSGTARNTGLI